jgi:hypothetical protein
MRRLAYISILIGVWLFGMTALMLGLDDLLFRGRLPGWFLFCGAQLAAFATVSLVEEAAEVLDRIHPGLRRRFFVCSAGVAQRQLPGS